MARATFRINTPDILVDTLQIIQSHGLFVNVNESYMLVNLEAEDEFNMGLEIKELMSELESLWSAHIPWTRVTGEN